jgi:hypothetical protein
MIGRVLLKTELEVEKGHIRNCRLTVLRQFLSPGDLSRGGRVKTPVPDDAVVTGARDYGNLVDIMGEDPAGNGGEPGPSGRLDQLAEGLAEIPHDPDALRTAILKSGLVKPGWIDIFVKGFFQQT